MKRLKPMLWIALRYLLFVAAIVGIRGFGLAAVIDGRYSSSEFLADCLGLFALMAICHFFYFLLRLALTKLGITNRPAVFLVKLAFVVFAAFPLLLTTIQVHPQKIVGRQNPKVGGVSYEDVTFSTDGLALRGWLLNPTGAKPPMLLLHGLNANKGNFLPIAAGFSSRDFPVLIFDLEAHGESDGRQTTFGFREKRDVAAAAGWLQSRYPGRPMVAVGYSLGGAALLQAMADKFLFHRIVVDATYGSLREIVEEKFLSYLGPFKPLLWGSLAMWGRLWTGVDLSLVDNRQAIAKLDSSRILLIHGTADQMIPVSHGRALQAATGGKVRLWEIPGAGHLGTIQDPKYFETIDGFLTEGL